MRGENILDLLHDDHMRVQEMFERAERADDDELFELIVLICEELTLHAELEELIFYGFLREATTEEQMLAEASVEHESAKWMIRELMSASDPIYARALVNVLCDYVDHHIKFEEAELFPLMEQIGVDLEALGLELEERRMAMLSITAP
jgi:hypothetical protein